MRQHQHNCFGSRKGMQAKGPVSGPNAGTPAPTACRQRTPAAFPKDGQPGEGEHLTPDVPHEGTRHPPPPRGREECVAYLEMPVAPPWEPR